MAKSDLHRDYILELENELQEFEKKADSTTKRMKLLVYPAMIAFFILSAFGFYLIFSLTSDVRRMANTFVHMSGSIETNMDSISGTMGHMSDKMDILADSTSTMSTNVESMTNTTADMSSAIGGMKPAIYDMAASTNNMQRDFWSMNKNISTPLSFMNNFLPWKESQSLPFQGSRAPLPPSYYSYPAAAKRQTSGAYNSSMMPAQIPVPFAPIPAPNNYLVPPMVPATEPVGVTADTNEQSLLVAPIQIISPSTYSLNN